MIKRIAMFLSVSILLYSCYYDKEDILYDTANSAQCDTMAVVSYSQHVVPLLQSFCYNCHAGNSPSGGVLMGTHASDSLMALNGSLYGTIAHAAGYSPMPDGQPKLSACKINIIRRWIDEHAPAN